MSPQLKLDIFGSIPVHPEEGARELIHFWKEHTQDCKAMPGPDYRALNKRASKLGLASGQSLRDYRKAHHIPLKQGVLHRTRPVAYDSRTVFGRPSGHKTMEEVRLSGREVDTEICALLQGSFASEWGKEHSTQETAQQEPQMPARATKASCGHALGASETMKRREEKAASTKHLFKMPRFQNVASKTITRR